MAWTFSMTGIAEGQSPSDLKVVRHKGDPSMRYVMRERRNKLHINGNALIQDSECNIQRKD